MENAMKLTRKHVLVSGKVQGVGFRWSARSEALKLGLTGWVSNLPDRRVELCFQGKQEAVDKMLNWCRSGPPCSIVTGIFVSEDTPIEGETVFEVR
jgi:acylphosphatase